MTNLAEDVPEARGIGAEGKAVHPEARDSGLHIGAVLAGCAHAGQVTLDIRQEHGYAHVGERLGHDLHGDGLAGAGRAGDQTVAVCHIGKQVQPLVRLCHPDFIIGVHRSVPLYLVVVILS